MFLGFLGMYTKGPRAFATAAGGFVLGTCLVAPAVAWIAYLVRPEVRAAFKPQPSASNLVPTGWIRLIAAGSCLGCGVGFAELLNPKPPPVFGLALHGFALGLYAFLSTAVLVYIGRGLYALSEPARRWALGYETFAGAQFLFWGFTAPTPHGGFSFLRAGSVFLFTGIQTAKVCYLLKKRELFVRRAPYGRPRGFADSSGQ